MSRDERGEAKANSEVAAPGEQRLDKWLWFARLAKTRTQAAALVTDGRIRVNRERTDKPAQSVKTGDVVTATVNHTVRVLKVVGFLNRRGPAAEAASIYEELTPAVDPTKARGAGADGQKRRPGFHAHAERAPGSGRPTKRDRRETDRLKDQNA